MTFFWISIVELSLAPLIYLLFQRFGYIHRYFDGVVFCLVASLVILHVLPGAFAIGGYAVILLALLGWVGPTLIERIFTRLAHQVDYVTLVVAVMGICLHGLVDGIALSTERYAFTNQGLPIAVILHRLPAAVFLWWLVLPKTHWTFASLVLGGLGMMTAVGYWFGLQVFPQYTQTYGFGLFQGFAAGSLLHLATHRLQDTFGSARHSHG